MKVSGGCHVSSSSLKWRTSSSSRKRAEGSRVRGPQPPNPQPLSPGSGPPCSPVQGGSGLRYVPAGVGSRRDSRFCLMLRKRLPTHPSCPKWSKFFTRAVGARGSRRVLCTRDDKWRQSDTWARTWQVNLNAARRAPNPPPVCSLPVPYLVT